MDIENIKLGEEYLSINIKLVYKDAKIISKEVIDDNVSVVDGYKLIKYLITKCPQLSDTDLCYKNGFLPLYSKASIIHELKNFKISVSGNSHKNVNKKNINVINADIQYIKAHNWKYVEVMITDNDDMEFLSPNFDCINILLGYLDYEVDQFHKHSHKHGKINISDDDLPFS